ncbi:MAG: hypothetical protein PSV35_05335, partial [bacterium]|nr:hypothetical protein [bacterium]
MSKDKAQSQVIEQSAVLSSSYKPITAELSPQAVHATLDSIELWAQKIFNPQVPGHKHLTAGLPTVNLSRFGLRTASDVVQFLRSPAGVTVIGEIGAELETEKALDNERQIGQRNHQLLMHRIKAILFLSFLEEKTHAADKIKEQILAQITKILHPEKETLSAPLNSQKATIHPVLADYDKAISMAHDRLDTLDLEKTDFLQEMVTLINQAEQREVKYNLYDSHLTEFEAFLAKNSALTEEEINAKLVTHTTHRDTLIDEMVKELDGDNTQLAELIKHQVNAIQLQIANLQDMLQVIGAKKHYVDASGTPVDSLTKATFILNEGQKIFKHDEKYYLLQPGQDVDSVKANPQALSDAQKNYEHKKQEIMTVKKVVHYHKGTETSDHNERVQQTEKKITQNMAEKRLIGNQISILQASRANAENLINQANEYQSTTPSPTLTPISSPKTNQTAAVSKYRQKISLQKKSNKLTPQELLDLIRTAPQNIQMGIPEEVKKRLMALSLSQAPVTQQTMQSLLQNLARFSVDPMKPSVTA